MEPDITRVANDDDEFPLLLVGTMHRAPSLRTGGGGIIGRAAITEYAIDRNLHL